jgi:hypothetical protein
VTQFSTPGQVDIGDAIVIQPKKRSYSERNSTPEFIQHHFSYVPSGRCAADA